MNQRQLQYFVALAEELHFVRAADRLHVTQSALSQQIARLEEIVGARLFTRAHRQVELTQAGRSFLDETRPLLRNMDLAVTLARRAAEGHSGRLRIGFADAAALNVLPDLIASFTQLYPGVKLVLHEMISQQQVEALHAGRIDVGLLRPVFPKDALSWLLLLREPYVVALARTHPLASLDSVSIADLRLETFITTSREKARYVDSRFRGAFHKAGFHPNIGQEVNELHAILSLVASGLGVALFPASVVGLTLKDLVYRPINADESPTAELILAWREDQDIATARHFIDVAGRLVDARAKVPAPSFNPLDGFRERDMLQK